MKALKHFTLFFLVFFLSSALVSCSCGDDDDDSWCVDDDDDDDDDDDNDDNDDDNDNDDNDTATCDGCLIDDYCYADGQTNPVNVCRICDVSASTYFWSPNNGVTCDDGVFCNGADTCNTGACSVHEGNPCDSQCESCNEGTDVCDPWAGSCDDGVFCNGADTCNAGSCSVHAGDPCDSQCEWCNEGTSACDEVTGSCDDGVFCNGADTCDAGSCSAHAGDPCDEQCESCNEGTDVCDPQAGSCDDGVFCNGDDTCSGGNCSVHAGDPCTGGDECNNICNEGTNDCLSPNTTACDDGVFCNGMDMCDGVGSCSVHAGDPCESYENCNEVFAECYDPQIETFIPEGAFWMGCEPDDTECFITGDEEPRHQVTLSPYYIGTYEVTNEEYAAFLTAHGNDCEGYACVDSGNSKIRVHELGGVWTAEPGYEDHPMVLVSWNGAKAFCEYYGTRLPTEAEWEKAAKGVAEHYIWSYGDTWIDNASNWDENGDPWEDHVHFTGYPWTTPVGYFDGSNHGGVYQTTDGRSPYGVHDMTGNVWEWVNDWYNETYYSTSPSNDPQGPATGTNHVFRGGCWANTDINMRNSKRGKAPLTYTGDGTGFRCSRD